MEQNGSDGEFAIAGMPTWKTTDREATSGIAVQ